VLPFETESFDAVFSSHCLRHSYDLRSPFSEVNRVLAPGGNLLMAVPYGWGNNPEHPYFFAPDEWVSVVSDAGFRVRIVQVGREYPEAGFDLFIAAQKISAPVAARLDPNDYQKASYRFIPCDDPGIVYRGERVSNLDHVVMTGEDWAVEIAIPAGAREIVPLPHRHE
jgi:SAM-dependent methyltransferase